MRLGPEGLTNASARHPWRTITVWVALVITMGGLSGALLGDVLTTDIAFTNTPESVRATNLVEEKFGGEQGDIEFLLVRSMEGATVDEAAFNEYVVALQSSANSLDEQIIIQPVATVYDIREQAPEQAAALVSRDETATLIPVTIGEDHDAAVADIRAMLQDNPRDGFEVMLAGPATLQVDTTAVTEEDLKTGESIGILVAFAVLIGVFGSIVAALLPIGISLVAIPVSLGMVALIGQLTSFNLFTQNMISMIGLAVGIDYSLFIVARFREEQRRGKAKEAALTRTGSTASRAVLFSGLTVVFALLGMFIIPTTIFRSMATGAILVVLVSVAASLTLLPALLSLLGDKINWPRLTKRAKGLDDPDKVGGFWDRATRRVMKRPVIALVASVLVLGGLASVYFTIDKGTNQSAASLPDEVESKKAFEVLSAEFAGGQTDPIKIIVNAPGSEVTTQVAALQSALAADEAYSDQVGVVPASDGSAVMVTALLQGNPFANSSFDAVRSLRSDVIPAAFDGTDVEVVVGGQTAFFTDFLEVSDAYQPLVFALVLGMSFLLLMMVFRSVVVPLKAVLMNLLSVGAAYGAIVLVFQHGVGIGFFNAIGFKFQQVEAIEAWLPLFLFSVLFGLSMDYHVFLLSRIKEYYDRTGNNDEAVAFGLRTTASIITGAALIMVAVFTAFALGRLAMMQQMGFGLAVAVLLDATIVRTILVPASMKLLGDRNWYLPRWLEWLPKIQIEGASSEDTAVVADAADEGERASVPASL